MAVKLRLQRRGRSKAPFYHIVAADSRSPRDGRFIEKIGTYNPLTVPATIELNNDRALYWMMTGAQPSDTVRAILSYKGIMLRKHLQMGVAKGAITQEQADEKLAAWVADKDNKVTLHREATAEKKRQFIIAMDGKPKIKAKPVVEEEAPVLEESAEAEAAAEETAVSEEPAAE